MRYRFIDPRAFAEEVTKPGYKASSDGERLAVRGGLAVRELSVDGQGENAPLTFTVSNGDVDRYNTTIAPAGWSFTNYRNNPVVLWGHKSYGGPENVIGRSLAEWVEGDKVKARFEFTPKDLNRMGDMVRRLYLGGFMRAVSVSWDPLEYELSATREDKGYWYPAIDYKRQDLLEVSAVPVPGNAGALIEARSAGIDTSPLVEWAERELDELFAVKVEPSVAAAAARDARDRRITRLEGLRRAAGAESPIIVIPASREDVRELARRIDTIASVVGGFSDRLARTEPLPARAVPAIAGDPVSTAAAPPVVGEPTPPGGAASAPAAPAIVVPPARTEPIAPTAVPKPLVVDEVATLVRQAAREELAALERRVTGRLD